MTMYYKKQNFYFQYLKKFTIFAIRVTKGKYL